MRCEGTGRAQNFLFYTSRTISSPSTGQPRPRWTCRIHILYEETGAVERIWANPLESILIFKSVFFFLYSIRSVHEYCIRSAKTCLQDRTILLCISYRLPYLSDPVVPQLYQPGKVTHEGWRCPLHRKIPVGTGTGRTVSVNCLPDSKNLEKGRGSFRENAPSEDFLFTNWHSRIYQRHIEKWTPHFSHC